MGQLLLEFYRLWLPHLLTLAMSIAQLEGFHVPGSRADRNHNPGNLKHSRVLHQKDEGGFCVFRSPGAGWYALLLDLQLKCQGRTRTRLSPDSTLRDLIHVWAPSHENDTRRYVMLISAQTGFDPSIRLRHLMGAADEYVVVVD